MKVLCGRPHAVPQKRGRYLRFAEKLNGRCAMQGTLWSGTGNHQFDALVALDPDNELSYSVFTPEAELENGRLAAYFGYRLLA